MYGIVALCGYALGSISPDSHAFVIVEQNIVLIGWLQNYRWHSLRCFASEYCTCLLYTLQYQRLGAVLSINVYNYSCGTGYKAAINIKNAVTHLANSLNMAWINCYHHNKPKLTNIFCGQNM